MRRAARKGIKQAEEEARRAEHRKQVRSNAKRKANQTIINLVPAKGIAKRLQRDPAKRLKFLVRASRGKISVSGQKRRQLFLMERKTQLSISVEKCRRDCGEHSRRYRNIHCHHL